MGKKILVLCFLIISLAANAQKVFSLYFENNSARLSEACRKSIDSIFSTEKSIINSVRITGHCDSTGTTEYNQKLSEARAGEVSKYLVSKGMNKDSIFTKGMGENHPRWFGSQSYLNRRVEVEILFVTEKAMVIVEPQSELEKEIAEADIGDLVILKNIEFYGGLDIPLPEAAEPLYDLLATMKKNPSVVISIEGHICCSQDDAENLSGKRAKAVYDYLISKGIDAKRLSYQGFGHSRPLTPERNEDERRANRRVEVRILKK